MKHVASQRNSRLKWVLVRLWLGTLLTYLCSYTWLSRVGIAEAEAYGLCGFLYVPIDEVQKTHDLTWHHRLKSFYDPLNAVDRTLFDTMGPIGGIMFDIR